MADSGSPAPVESVKEGHELSGTIYLVPSEAPVFVYLIQARHMALPGIGYRFLRILPEPSLGHVHYCFPGLAVGLYALRVFQDVDGDAALDMGLWGPREPWALSWQTESRRMPPSFEDIAFLLSSNMTLDLRLAE